MDQKLPVPETVPVELGGKWLAWSADGLRIITHGDSFLECKEKANEAGETDPCFERTPRAGVRIIRVAQRFDGANTSYLVSASNAERIL